MAFLNPIVTFDELKRRHRLSVLDEVADFTLVEGGLKMTRDGDIFMGVDDAHCGMRRLVVGWSYLTPTLAHLIASRTTLLDERAQLEAEMERQHTLANPMLYGETLVTRAHRAQFQVAKEALDAGEQGCITLAGSTIMLLQQLLDRFRHDVAATAADWNDAGSTVNGVSAGRLVWAAANAYRHADEWNVARASGKITGQQRSSMDVLDEALGGSNATARVWASWEQALDVLCGRSLEALSERVLPFANEVAVRVRGRAGK